MAKSLSHLFSGNRYRTPRTNTPYKQTTSPNTPYKQKCPLLSHARNCGLALTRSNGAGTPIPKGSRNERFCRGCAIIGLPSIYDETHLLYDCFPHSALRPNFSSGMKSSPIQQWKDRWTSCPLQTSQRQPYEPLSP